MKQFFSYRSVKGSSLRAFLYFVLVWIPSLLIVGGFLRVLYITRVEKEMEILSARAQSEVRLQREVTAEVFDRIAGDLLVISGLHELTQLIEEPETRPPKWLESDLLSFVSQKRIYDQIRYIDGAGMERVRINFNEGQPSVIQEEDLQDKSGRYYFTDTVKLERGQIFVSPLDLNIEGGVIEDPLKPMLRIGTPVFSAGGEPRGMVILNYLAKNLLDQVERLSVAEANRFYFLNSEGYWLRGEDASKEWGFMFEERRDQRLDRVYPQVWGRIQQLEQGQIFTADGLFTYTTFYPLKPSMYSSSGVTPAFLDSHTLINEDEYSFIILTHVRAETLAQIRQDAKRDYTGLFLLLSVIITFMCAVLSIVAHKKRHLDRAKNELIVELQSAMGEIRTLQGILPICSNCKKIQEGEGEWSDLDLYVRKNADVDFSHGLCPGCAKELYPEYADEL